MRSFRTPFAISLASALLLSTAASADMASIEFPAFSHPNGAMSASGNAVDDRDYGLRLDTETGPQTFHFVDVTMKFHFPDSFDNNTIMAEITGTIAHLQSTDGGAIGYQSASGYDAEDQQYQLQANLRVIGEQGSWASNALPYHEMTADLLNTMITSNQITFSLNDTTLTPRFQEPAVFDGPLVWDEKPGSDANPNPGAFYLAPRHRLSSTTYPGPSWDVLGAAGWLEPAPDTGRDRTTDFLFYLDPTPVPEPATAILLFGGLAVFRRKILG